MTTQTVRPQRLIESIQALVERFRHELTGPRQATRTQLVQFLAQALEIDQTAAGRLFDNLRDAGVIVRGDEPLADSEIPERDRQNWSIETEDADGTMEQLEAQIQAAVPDQDEPQVLHLLRRAITQRATDVHLDPFGDEIEIRFRIDGRLAHYCRVSKEIGEQLMSQLKVLAELDPAESFHPQDGRLALPVSLFDYDARMTSTPVAGGQAVAVRLLHREQILRPVDALGLTGDSLEAVRQLLRLGEGMVLICGPSGAGKTTTLYSLVHHIDDGHRSVVTTEEPVEYLVPGFLQVQVDRRHDLSFATGLKTALRMDPDVILLGEVRDAETAAAAMRAASSGKYLFSTFHTRDAASAVTGMRDLDVHDRSLADNLRAIIAQRLVRRLCLKCRDTRPIREAEAARFEAEGLAPPNDLPLKVGCDHCHHTGYYERIGVFEIAIVTADLAAAIESGKSERELREFLRTAGTASLAADGLAKVRQGITTLEEIESMSCLN